MKSKFTRNEIILVLVLIAVKLVIHFLTNTHYDLHRDSFLYYAEGQHLAWGYASVPPFIGFMAWLSNVIFGHSAFGLNFFPAIIGGISILLITLIVKALGGGWKAILISTFAFLVSPAYLRSNTLFQPVSFDQFFWLLAGYFIVKLLSTDNPKYWIHICIVFAIGFLNKYLIAAYAISLLLALMIGKERKLLFSSKMLWGVGIGFVLVLPNLIWQYTHNFPVVHHMNELNQNQLVHVNVSGFLLDQVFMNIPGFFVWLLGLILLLVFKPVQKYRSLGFAALFVILLLLVLRGKSYYTLGIYPLLFAAGGLFFEKYVRKGFQIGVFVFMLLASLPALPISLPILNFRSLEAYTKVMNVSNRWEDGEIHPIPQDYADMTGWKELGALVVKVYNSLPENEKKDCAIYAENYGLAGAIKYYSQKQGLPEPICFSDNFLLWAPDSLHHNNLIYVNDEIGDIKKLYHSYTLKGEITDKYFRESGVKVFYCKNPNDSFKKFYATKVAELKSIYKRERTLN